LQLKKQKISKKIYRKPRPIWARVHCAKRLDEERDCAMIGKTKSELNALWPEKWKNCLIEWQSIWSSRWYMGFSWHLKDSMQIRGCYPCSQFICPSFGVSN